MKSFASDLERVLRGLRIVIHEAHRHNSNSIFTKIGRIQYHAFEILKLFYDINSSNSGSSSTTNIKYDHDVTKSTTSKVVKDILNEDKISNVVHSKETTDKVTEASTVSTNATSTIAQPAVPSDTPSMTLNTISMNTQPAIPYDTPSSDRSAIAESINTTTTTNTPSNNDNNSNLKSSDEQPAVKSKMREKSVPATPIERVIGFGSLAAGLLFGKVKESTNSVLFGAQENSGGISEENANRLADSLSRMRGAALKLGQMLR
jgi:hypothetical protein